MRRPIVFCVLCLLVTTGAVAIERVESAGDPRLRSGVGAQARSAIVDVDDARDPAAGLVEGFVARRGGDWTIGVDPRTGRAASIEGSGVPLFPGKGNTLSPGEFADLFDDRGEVRIDAVEPAVRALIDGEAGLLLPPRGSLELDPDRSLSRRGGRLVSVYYTWSIDGVPVEGAGVFARVNHGNMVQLGAPLVGPTDVDVTPVVDEKTARRALLDYSGDQETARFAGPLRLVVQVEEDGAGALVYRPVWVATYTILGRIETWEGRIDAHTGEVVSFRDTNHYTRAVGGVYPRTIYQSEEVRVPLPTLDVDVDGTPTITDNAGSFAFGGGPVDSGLDGDKFNTNCQGCSNPAQPGVEREIGSGWIDFGFEGLDNQGNGLSTAADRMTFYHLNRVRRIAQGWLPTLGWLDATINVNTNINAVCNATYNGAVNFYRSGSGCNNTGLVADVIYHEWGHGIDLNTNAGVGGIGEGTADVTSMQITHSPLVGPGFRTNGNPVRNVDQNTNGFGIVTRTNYETACGGGVHCEGQAFGQAAWELSQLLTAALGHHTGWRVSERLFFTSLPDAETMNPVSLNSIAAAYDFADDDDGNLSNGTPHQDLLFAAFDPHGLARQQRPTSAACSRPDQPQVTVAPACDTIDVSWTAAPTAEEYVVLRSELLEDTAYRPVATLGAGSTSWIDGEVAPDLDYHYIVMAVDAAGCESTIESPVASRLLEQPILTVEAVATDDVPKGNRSGFPDPGEDVDLVLELRNVGLIEASSVAGTVVPLTAGVTMLEAAASWQSLNAEGRSPNDSAIRFTTDDQQVACGALVEFRFDPLEGTGCASDASYFSVRLGEPDGQGGFTCDPTPACFVPPSFDGLQVAAPGASCGEVDLAWDPAATNCQNAEITYNVYRGAPGFVPGPGSLIAADLSGQGFADALLAPGASYEYVVRAYDSRSGEEQNVVVRAVDASTAADIRPPVFDGLATLAPGASCGETELGWSAALETCSGPVSYDVYRSLDPAFVPDSASLVATTLSTSLVDATLEPGASYTYVVRARDGAGNVAASELRLTAAATALDLTVAETKFEPDTAGWTVLDTPSDPPRGEWEWGDPELTEQQPGDDFTVDGVNCWTTGRAASNGGTNNDVDDGVTVLLSAPYDLTGSQTPAVRYARWVSNDRGNRPAEDPLVVEVSDDDGASWTLLESVNGDAANPTPLEWVDVEHGLGGLIAPTATVRFRFSIGDVEGEGSLVEAAIDEFRLVDIDQGCSVCTGAVSPVQTINVDRVGDDVSVGWAAVSGAERYAIYRVTQPLIGEDEVVLIGTTGGTTFAHEGAMLSGESFSYRVAAIDACGELSELEPLP